ncbi:vWA domain-containing protein [Mucisphaera sp.]|uniref:vWA domain-containing protein n=1 Tax=Mucisphaera sp. TaxID=2913024 RepID=UPI003D0C9902
MTFLAPLVAGIAAAVAIPALLVLYFLKLRRQRRDVASTLLWQKAIQDFEVNSPFQRLRGSWLLLLQLLLLVVLLLALSRPVIDALSIETGRAVILIDASASMGARSASGQTRLERAQAVAEDLVERLDVEEGGGRAMVVRYAMRPTVLQTMTGDKGLLRAAIAGVSGSDEPTRLLPALRLVQPMAEQAAAAETAMTVYVVSDGGSDQAEVVDRLDLHGAEVVFVPVDPEAMDEAENVAITAFSGRRDPESPERVALFAQVTNFGAEARSVTVRFRVDGEVRRTQEVSLAGAGVGAVGREAMGLSLELPEVALVSVEHDGVDALVADDRAHLVVAASRTTSVLLVSEGNRLMEHALEAAGIERVTVGDLSVLDTPGALAADVWIFDRLEPVGIPQRPSLSFGVVPGIAGLELVERGEGEALTTRLLDWRRGHPLLRHVSFDDLLLRDAGRLVLPQGARVLATSASGPLMAEVRVGTQRHVVAAFDPLRSNWPVMVGFPVFFDNALRYLGAGGEGETGVLSVSAGEAWSIPRPGGGAAVDVVYEGPERVVAAYEGGSLVFPPLERVGLYRAAGDVEPLYGVVAVNLLDPAESDLRRVAADGGGASGGGGGVVEVTVPTELWGYLAVAGLVLLMGEWVFYTLRTRV